MHTVRVVETTPSHLYKVHFWVVGAHTPASSADISTLDPQLAVELRPYNAECFGFTRQRVQQRVVQLIPRGPHSRDVVIDDEEPLPGMHYIDGTVYNGKGLRGFADCNELMLKMHFSGADRMVRTRYGNFTAFYGTDSVIKT